MRFMQIQRTTEDADKQIDETINLVKAVVGEKVLGIYLYGSYIQGGLMPQSDIDIFVLLNDPTDDGEKQQLVKGLLEISIEDPNDKRRPIELNMATQAELKPWSGSPHMDFQYGEWIRQEIESGKISPSADADTDLAIIVTQVLTQGKKLYGEDASQLLDPLPFEEVQRIMVSEVDGLLAELQDDTRNVLLTLVRIWNSLESNTINSKQDAAAWALDKIPQVFKPLLEHALAVRLGKTDEDWGSYQTLVRPFSEYIVSEIKKSNL